MNVNGKPLPKAGTWLRVVGLPAGTTDEQLSALLRSRGLNVGAECICVKDCGEYASAFVVLTSVMLCELLKSKMPDLRVAPVSKVAA